MNKEFYDKYQKDLDCASCPHLINCMSTTSPQCLLGTSFYLEDLVDQLKQQLKQQVEEKDKEIAHLKEITIFKDSRNMTTKINGVDFSDEQIITLQNLDILKKYDQTQLAITELEKVKEKISKLPITDILDTDYGGFKKIYQTDAMSIIDRQINELKGE